jgi:hypothetical protein
MNDDDFDWDEWDAHCKEHPEDQEAWFQEIRRLHPEFMDRLELVIRSHLDELVQASEIVESDHNEYGEPVYVRVPDMAERH